MNWEQAGEKLLGDQDKFNEVGDIRATDSEGTLLDNKHPRWQSLLHWCLDAYFGRIFNHLHIGSDPPDSPVRSSSRFDPRKRPRPPRPVFRHPKIRCPNATDSNHYLWCFVSVVYSLELDYQIVQWKKGNRQPIRFDNLVLRYKADFQSGIWHRFCYFWEPFIRFLP